MYFIASLGRVVAGGLVLSVAVTTGVWAEQAEAAGQPATGAVPSVKIAVIDIDRVAAESNSGKALFDDLRKENDRIAAEKKKLEDEMRDMQGKLASDILSADARERLTRELDRKRIDAERWLEDAQRDFQTKQQAGEAQFQEKLAPVVEAVAKEAGIGLILRATPGLTFVLDPALDITPSVVERLNQVESASPGSSNGDSEDAKSPLSP